MGHILATDFSTDALNRVISPPYPLPFPIHDFLPIATPITNATEIARARGKPIMLLHKKSSHHSI